MPFWSREQLTILYQERSQFLLVYQGYHLNLWTVYRVMKLALASHVMIQDIARILIVYVTMVCNKYIIIIQHDL